MTSIKNLSFYLVCALIINCLAKQINSDFIGPFLRNNLVSILINLLAINIATCTILMTKLNEIKEKSEVDFSSTYKELKLSLKEQVFLISISFITLMFDKSTMLIKDIPHFSLGINIILTFVFIYAIDILWDIDKAVFTIINH